MKVVLGLKLDPWHDTGAAIVVDDGSRLRIVAISQERLDRIKHSRAFPAQAITYCLETIGCGMKDLSLVVSDFIMAPAVDDRATGAEQPAPDAKQEFFQKINNLGIPTVFAEHHVCHAASAYYATDWDDATTLVIDGHGSHYETQSIFSCRGNGITKIAASRRPSIGWMYNAVTELLLGFQHLQEGKTMGLAGHAKDGGVWTEYFKGKSDAHNPCQIVYDTFVVEGQLWKLAAPDHLPRRKPTDDPVSSPFAQYAYAAQSSLESDVMQLVRAAARMLPGKHLCYSGGVALNIPANRMILDSGLYEELFIQPAASDSGIPLGAALLGYYSVLGGTLRWKMDHAFLGREYTPSLAKAALTTWQGPCSEYSIERVARLLSNDYLVAWSHGASEYGPRALGHRSILCSPRDPHMKAYLNREVKHREMFRPFAPIVPIEDQSAYFDLRTPSPFMLINSRVHPDMAAAIPAVVHADGTARVQSIHRGGQPELHALLSAVGAITGIPVLLNTSLNLAGEPIVETPVEAVDLFKRSRLDALVLEQHLLTKKPLSEMLALRNPGLASIHTSIDKQRSQQVSSALPKKTDAFNILFYIEPLVDKQKDAFIRGSHYIITNIVDTLKKNPQFEINTLILANPSFKEGLEGSLKIHCKEIPEKVFLDYYHGADRYEIISKSFRNEHSKKALAFFAKEIRAITAEFNPDVVVASVPVPFLRQLFPNALTLHVEAGLLTTHPFSKSLFFDPVGLWSTSFIDRFAEMILKSDLSPDQQNSMRRLKQVFCAMIEADNPFQDELKILKGRHKKLVLLSLPFIRDLKNDPGFDYGTIEEFVVALLKKIGKNTGVLLATHPDEKMVGADTIKNIQHAFPNVEYLGKKQGYSASLFAMPFVDAVVNVCSKTALWSLFFDKKLFSIGKTFSAISDWPTVGDFNIDKNIDPLNKDSLLFYLLTKYYVSEKYYTDGGWMSAFVQRSIHKNKSGHVDAHFYDAIDGDTTIIEDLIQRIESYMKDKKEKESSLPKEKNGLEFTGERFVPELDGQIAYEHFHRYAFASELAKDKRVLDIASGEGYGSAMLANVALEVVGVDISEQAVNHARGKYENIANLSFRLGECKKIPCQDGYFDAVISFETLEHTKDQADFLSEIKRVLRKDGMLIISTPNKKIYSDDKHYANPYHLLELNEEDFHALLNSHFKHTRLWGQRLTFSSHLWPMHSTEALRFKHYQLSPARNYIEKNEPPFDAEYYIAVCSDNVNVPDNCISLYTGLQDELYTDYFKRYEWGKSLEIEVESKNNFIRALQDQLAHGKIPEEQDNDNESLAGGENPLANNCVPKKDGAAFDVDSRYADAQTLVQTGKIEEALTALIDIIHAQPDHAGAHNELGFLYYQKQDRVHALMHYERAVALDQQSNKPLRNLADFYYVEMGRIEDAQLLYSKILSIQPDDLEVLQILANICVSRKQLVAANAVFAKILRLMPENTDARNAIEAIEKYRRDAITQATPEHLYKESVVLSNAGLLEESIALLENLTGTHPEFALAHNDLGVLYGNKGNLQKAQEYYEKAATMAPQNITFAKNLADVHAALNNIEEAARIYDRILSQTPDDIEALTGLGRISIEIGRYDTARCFLQKILEINPENTEARQCLDALQAGIQEDSPHLSSPDGGPPVLDSNAAENNGQTISAAALIHDAPLHEALLAAYQRAQDLLESVKGKSKNGKQRSDKDISPLVERIQPFINQCKFVEAVQRCLEAFDGNQQNPWFLLLLGRLFHRAGCHPQAAFFFERAGALDRGNVEIQRRVEMFKRAIAVLPTSRTDIENFCDPDIILVQAPGWGVNTPPLGTAMLTSFARSSGYKVLPVDLNIEFYLNRPAEFSNTWELEQSLWFWNTRECVEKMLGAFRKKIDGFLDLVLAANTRAVGFTLYNSSSHVSLELARMLKRLRPELPIIFGGPQVSRFADGPAIIKDPAVDAAAQGEGEKTLITALERIKNGQSLSGCPGLLVREENRVIDTGDNELIKDLDQVPAPDFSDYTFEIYRTPTRLPLSSSRGCVNQCIFCNERPFWKHYRSRSAENVFAEIMAQFERYPFINFLDFQDSLVNGNIRELERLADLIIENKLNVQWAGQAVIRKEMTSELMMKLKQSGCVCMAYGLETPSASLMLKVGKVISRGADVDAIAAAHGKTGLGVTYNIMFGLPGETEEDAFETLEFVRRNKNNNIAVNPSPSFCGFSPGSFAYENPGRYGIDLTMGGTFWQSTDGENTYLRRLKRFEDFCRLVKELGISTTYPSSALLDRNRALGHYYFHIGDRERARQYYDAWITEHPDDREIHARLDGMQSVQSRPASSPDHDGYPADTDGHVTTNEQSGPVVPSSGANGIICVNPFFEFEIDITGRVVVCCTGWFRHSLGNMKKQTIAEVWNSQVARYVRRKMYKGEWEDICSPHCPTIVHYKKYGTVIPYSELHKNKNLTAKHVEEILAGKDRLESTPTYFKLSDSKICNLTCKMCGVVRGKDFVDDKEMIKKRTKDIMQYLDQARTILLCGNGDPFARPDTRELLINYKSTNPDLKFCLITNGLLLPKYWEQVKHQNFESIDISVDAASKEVYERIRVGGKWEHILNVLDLVKENKHRFGSVLISMVVMRSNFKEIPAFIDMVESYGFLPMFSRIQGQFDDENIFEMKDRAALDELRAIVTNERKKKRTVDVIWQDIIEFADERVKEGACLVKC